MLKDAHGASEGQAAPSPADGRGRRLLACVRCGRVITSTDDRFLMNGSHEHAFVNPDGEQFLIGCFSGASGLLHVGPSTLEYTWFAGYSWQSVVCAGCRIFLGWFYRQGEHRFHGLILDRLVEIDAE